MNFNKAIIIGNLTRDPEVKTTPNGHNVATYSVATNRFWTKPQGERQQFTEYHNIVAWGKLADISSQYLKKGSLVMIEGRLQTRSWEGQDGVKRYRTEIVTENMQLGPRSATSTAANPTPAAEEDLPTIQQDEPVAADQPDKGSQTSPGSQTAQKEVDVENIPFWS